MAEHKRIKQEGQEELEEERRLKKKTPQPIFDQLKAPDEGILGFQVEPSVDRHATLLAGVNSEEQQANLITQLQQSYGNAYVQRVMERIQGEKGSGKSLEPEIRTKMETVLNQDFGDIRIHADAEANKLAEELGAQAFTMGKDIFFQEGTYQPGSEAGKGLLAHELAHVVQQNSVLPVDMGVRFTTPGDEYEQEAEATRRSIQSGTPVPVPRQMLGAPTIAGDWEWDVRREESREWEEYDELLRGLRTAYPEVTFGVLENDAWGPKRWRIGLFPGFTPEELTRHDILYWLRRWVPNWARTGTWRERRGWGYGIPGGVPEEHAYERGLPPVE